MIFGANAGNSNGLKLACDLMEKQLVFHMCNSIPKILALDARGFIFGSIIADRNNLNLVGNLIAY